MKNKLLTLACIVIYCVVFSQKKSTATLDSIKVNHLLSKTEALTDIDESEKINDLVLKICKEKIADNTIKKSQRKFFVDSYLTALLSDAYYEEQRGNAKKSIDLNLFVLKLAEKHKNNNIQGYANLALGSIFAVMPDYNKAEHYFKKALKNCEDDNNEVAVARICSNLTYVYIKTDNTKEATIYLQKALKINQKLDNKDGISSGLMGLAKINWMNKNYAEAKKNYLKAIQIQNEIKDFSTSANAYKNLYKVEQESGNLNQAILYLNKSNELSIQTNNSAEIIETSKILYEHFKKQNNYEKALAYYEKAIAEENKINKEEFNNAIIKAEFKYETEKKDNQLKQLSQAKKITELQNQRQKTTLLLLIFGIVSASISAFLLFKRYKANKQNELLKSIIEKSEAEKKATESELKALKSQMNPHFIFNALNSIQEQFMYGDKVIANEQMGNFTYLTRQILAVSGKKKIPLSTEVDILTKYLELEKMRFDNDFTYSIAIDDTIDDEFTELPPMLIQPFVENSIKHGLLHKEGNKTVSINFTLDADEEFLICTVEDNGIGRKKSEAIKTKNNHNSFSISAVAQRLQLINNDNNNDGLHYIDLEDKNGNVLGTKAILKIALA